MPMGQANGDFGLTQEQRMIRESVLPMLENVLPRSRILELDEAREFPHEAYAALAQAGWMGLPHEDAYGGSGGSYKELTILVETMGYHSAQLASAYLTTVVYGGMQLKYGGSPELKSRLMPELIAGNLKLALCMTEPDTGSDVASIRTRAQRDGDSFLISGQKIYITCAHVADYLVVVTKTNPAAGHKGITVFLVDAKAPGVSIRPMKALGRRMIHANEVFFDIMRTVIAKQMGL
jgi:acyl-CoA dehydrogenase